MASAEAINQAASTGIAGLDAEAAGRYSEAFDLYQRCSQELLETDSMRKLAFQRQISDVLDSAERVRNKSRREEMERQKYELGIAQQRKSYDSPRLKLVPPPPPPVPARPMIRSASDVSPSSTAVAVRQTNTTVAGLGSAVTSVTQTAVQLDRDYQIRQHVADGVRAGLATVRDLDERYDLRGSAAAAVTRAHELNQEHDISGKVNDILTTVGKSARAAVLAMREADQKYKIQERVSEAARDGVATARQLNEEYKISDKLVTGAKSALKTAKELDEQYHVRQKVGEAAIQGLNFLAAAARKANQALDERNPPPR